MKNKILLLYACTAVVILSCKKSFLEDMKSYDKYDESAFTNEVLTGQYIDRLYNYYFAAYRSPVQAETTLGSMMIPKQKIQKRSEVQLANYKP
jgi:hypothetical protein